MTLTIDLTPDVENRLKTEAQRQGVAPEDFARQLIEERLAPPASSAPTAPSYEGSNSLTELFKKWDAEDATDDPAELERRRREWEELTQSLNDNHGSYRKPIP